MTDKVFWRDPYLARLDTTVSAVDGDTVGLEETVFYALSGGQESDCGSIAGHPVREARWEGRDILYDLAPGHGLAPGDAARVEIDWDRRHALMRLHFAAEIVLELAYRRWPGVEKIGAHIAADKARIDFRLAESVGPVLPELAAAAQAIIDADYPITSAFSDEATERRYWEIPGFSRVPCGGTHLRRAGEVGRMSLKRKNTGKGKERIEVFVE